MFNIPHSFQYILTHIVFSLTLSHIFSFRLLSFLFHQNFGHLNGRKKFTPQKRFSHGKRKLLSAHPFFLVTPADLNLVKQQHNTEELTK